MTKAYQALFANRYGAARKAFAEALRVKPADRSAASALQQSLAADKTTSLNGLLANARAYEKREEWASAKSNYQTVLQRDSSQVSAKLGVIRTGVRQELDEQIRQVLSDTLAFSRDETNGQATKLLQDAKLITSKGSNLLAQIAELEGALAQAGRSVKVSLLSDNFTAISLQKIGSKAIKFGSFKKKNIALKPGRYVAVGVRLGYRDVRTEIELHVSGNTTQTFTIICDDKLSTTAARAKG
jgi:tetratricopeptide (TPR) repeat protein